MVVDWGSKRLEYFFAGSIQCKPVGEAVPMEACEVLDFGTTTKTEADLNEYLRLARLRFKVVYDAFAHNCNNFSDEVARFLTGLAVPERILNMANEALSTPRGKALRGLLGGFECVDNTLKQHRSQFLRRCSKGLLFLRQNPEPTFVPGASEDDSARDETPRRNPPARTRPDRTSRDEPDETHAADVTAAATPQRHRPPTPFTAPDATTPDAAPDTAATDASLDDELSPAARLRRGKDVAVIPDETDLAAYHAASPPAAAPAAALPPPLPPCHPS